MAACNAITSMMAAEAAAEIVSQKLEMLRFHPVCVRCPLMEPVVKEAREKLAMIQEFFSSRDSVSLSMVGWLGRLLQAMYDAEDFIDKFHLREACGRHKALHTATRPPAALISKCKLRRDLSNLVNKMRELCQDQYLTGKEEAEGKTRKASPASVPGQDEKRARLTSLWEWQVSMNSLWREKKEEIKKRIGEGPSSGNLGWTLIKGEPGVGKTSLARWVYDEAMYLGFEWRAWVPLSASMNVQEFLFEALKQMRKLARDVKGTNLNEVTEILYKKLAKGKKFLIVLDGVHASNVQLLGGLVKILCHGRGHVIITTQDDLMVTMGLPEEPIERKKLDSGESQKMLARKLGRAPDGQNLSDEEKTILKTCQDLPLFISLLGGLLPNAGQQERAALAKNGSKISLLDLLRLSYQKLPAPLKPCFIYMALFPRATPILTRKLVRLWLAEGLLDSHCYHGEEKPTRAPEDVGETFILELAERNMIDVVSWRADGSPKTCHMLNSLYDLIRPIAMDTGFLHVHDTRKSKDENDYDPTGQQQQLPAQPRKTKVRWLAEHTNIVKDSRCGSCPDLNLGYIRSFLSFYMRRGVLTKDISTFLRHMTSETAYRLLRVLDLEGVYKPSLQGVLHKLVLLKYLGLRSTVLHSIPRAVVDLQYLETLDIKDTYITSLPSSFWKARNLRHLHLNWCYIDLKKILKAGNALTKLQTLSGLVVGEVKENKTIGHMDSLTTLKLFLHRLDRETSGTAREAVADWISFSLTNLQSLTLGATKKAKPTKEAKSVTSQMGLLPKLSLAKHHGLFVLYLLGQLKKPIWTQLLPVSLRVLTLSGSRVQEDMMAQLGDHLKNLRTLRLLANSFLGISLRFAKDGFPGLVVLKFWKLPQLEEVIIEQGAMLHLQRLEFRRLDAMKKVTGVEECKEVENICVAVKKGGQHYVDDLKKKIREEKVLYKIEDTETSESADNDEDYSDDDN